MTKERMLITLGLLVLFATIFCMVVFGKERRVFSILGKDKAEFVIQPMVAPILYVRQVSGSPMPESGALGCEFKTDIVNGVKTVAGYCENGVVVHLTGIDLNH